MAGLTFHLIPHTHWDREWYLTRAGFLARLVPMMDDLLDRLERDDALRSFLLDGQTVLVEDYLRVRPEHRRRLGSLVESGRLEVGPWYVLADEQIPSGESLIRNLLAGAADAGRLGGRSGALYSPDAFGHPAVLPALAAEFGFGHGALWRGLGGEPGRENDLYRWRAPDGREIVLYHLPPAGYEVGAALPAGWAALREVLVARRASPHVAVMVGADHHAAHPSIGAVREAVARLEPGAAVRVSRLDDFLAQASEEAYALPVVRGELRWSYGYTWTLQGVHGTRAALKRLHSRAELALERIAEPLAALAVARGAANPRPLLDTAWRTLLRSQFHDSLAGCTSDDVARRVEARVEDAATLAAEVARTSFDALVGNHPDQARERPERTAPALVVWNPAPRPREGVAIVDLTWFRRDVLVGPPGDRTPRVGASPAAADIAGAVGGLPFQPLGRAYGYERLDSPHHYPDQDEVEITRVAVQVPRVGGLGFSALGGAAAGTTGGPGVTASGRRMENGLLRVEVSADGTVAITDLRTMRRYPDLLGLESQGDVGDTYSYAAPRGDRPRRPASPPRVKVLARGPLVGALELRTWLPAGRSPVARGPGRVDARLVLSLHAGSPALRCTMALDNQACDHRLRLRLARVAPPIDATAGGPFGPVVRQPVKVSPGSYPRERPVPTAPAHRFVACGDFRGGLALLAPGFFEYEHTTSGDLLVTLLRAVGRLSREDLPTRPGHAAWPAPTPGAQSLGPDRLQLALLPLDRGPDPAVLAEAWEDLFLPLRPVWLRQATPLAVPPGELRLEGDGLVFSALKPAESGDGLVLRCYNATGRMVEGTWHLPWPALVARVHADERLPDPGSTGPQVRSLSFTAAPHEILTWWIVRAPKERERGTVNGKR